ncbi:hypothetical protein IWZ03DRAFT_415911 [Phyllosticta citriasiana]|uniref:Uncharacterized protein n=1 Tax=Phyllosticta citriasiana TaxID=595635 RepID=A0ABR1KIB1_9PEZI
MASGHYEPLYNSIGSSEVANDEPQQHSTEDDSREVSNAVDAREGLHSGETYKIVPTTETAVDRRNSPGRSIYRKAARFTNDWWLWELCGVLLSAASMIAVIIICVRLNNTSLSDWNMGIGPNTLIAVLVTVAKAALLLPVTEGMSQLKWSYFSHKRRALIEIDWIEGASRGPWGSLLFFFRSRFRAVTISCGASLVIFALAMSPFAQQVISFEPRNTAQPGKIAAVPISRTYDSGLNLFGLAADVNPAQYTSREMQGAFFNGLFNLSTTLDFSCPSGNCTWPKFSSLGICSTCSRVEALETDVDTTYCDATYGESPKTCDVNATYTTPSNLTLEAFVYWQVSSRVSIYDYHALLSSFSKPSGTEEHDDLAVVGFARMPPLPDPEPKNVRNASIDWLNSAQLTECRLAFCAKTYQDVKVVDGSLVDNYTVTETPLSWSSQYWDGSRWFLRSSVNPNDGSFEPFDNQTAIIGYYDYLSTAGFVRNMLNFTLRDVSMDAYFDGTFAFSAGQAFNYSDSINNVMSTIATSMTNIVRRSSNVTAATGTVFEAQTFITVHWPWLSLPVALVVLAGGFLATNIWMSGDKKAPPIWKSSLVPLLFRGLESWEQDELRGEKKTELETLAATVQTQLRKNDSGNTQFCRLN